MEELHDYIRQARDGGTNHQAIRDRLVGAGWHPDTVQGALDKHLAQQTANEPPVTAAAPAALVPVAGRPQQEPIGVVKMYSTRGVEYYLMLIALGVSSTALGMLLLSIVEQLFGETIGGGALNTSVMAATTSALVVSLPIFALLFLRLKKAELANPRLRLDPSRRRMVQVAIIVSFIVGLFSLMGFLSVLLGAVYGGSSYEVENIGVLIANMLVIVGIAGGIFAYFWLDSHRKGEQ